MALSSSGIAQGPTIDLIVLYHSICGLDEKTGSLTPKCSTSMLYSFSLTFFNVHKKPQRETNANLY